MHLRIGKTTVILSFPCAVLWTLTAFVLPCTAFCAAASAILLHEGTHLLFLCLFHVPPQELTVGIFGMRLTLPAQPVLSYKKECLCALSAPLVNLSAFFVLLLLSRLTHGAISSDWATAQAGPGIVNLLPLRFLDGGRALLCVLLLRYDADKTEKLMRIIQFCCIPFPVLLCAAALYVNPLNYTAPVFAVYLLFLLILRK